MKGPVIVASLLIAAVGGCFCDSLPRDFASFTIEKKLEVYSSAIESCGRGSHEARRMIVAHHEEAVTAILPYITREKADLPLGEAAQIVFELALEDVPLRGSKVETELRRLLTSEDLLNSERLTIRDTLVLIEKQEIPRQSGFQESGLDSTIPET